MCPCMNSPTAVFSDIWTLPISGDCVCPDYKFSSFFISLQEQRLERLRLIHGNLPSSCFPSNAASSLQKAQCTKSPLQSLPHRDEELLGPISSPSPISAGLVLSTPTCNTHTSMLNNKNIIWKEWILPSGISELKKKNKKIKHPTKIILIPVTRLPRPLGHKRGSCYMMCNVGSISHLREHPSGVVTSWFTAIPHAAWALFLLQHTKISKQAMDVSKHQ